MDLSIVICCSDDFHIFKTLESIDENVDIVCSITPNERIEQLLRERNLRVIVTPKGNHSITTNAGIEAACYEKILLMDSDCVFVPGSLKKISHALDNYLVVNARIVFQSDNNLISRTISECRDFDNRYEHPAYKPGLGLHKKLLEHVDYWFHPLIRWPLDAELSYRVKKAGIPIKHIAAPCVLHTPTSLLHNFKACFNHGIGDCLRVNRLGQKFTSSLLLYELRRYKFLCKVKRIPVVMLMLINDTIYYIGYLWTFLELKAKRQGMNPVDPVRSNNLIQD